MDMMNSLIQILLFQIMTCLYVDGCLHGETGRMGTDPAADCSRLSDLEPAIQHHALCLPNTVDPQVTGAPGDQSIPDKYK